MIPARRALLATRTFRRWRRYHRPRAPIAIQGRGDGRPLPSPTVAGFGAWCALQAACGTAILSGYAVGWYGMAALGVAVMAWRDYAETKERICER